jgi:mRNA interferase RelE/StbE
MKIKFESKFSKDLRKIKDQKLLSQIKIVINECKLAQTLDDIKNLKKLKGYQIFYRIKIGDYRIGIAIINDELIFTRFLHRRENYRFFP